MKKIALVCNTVHPDHNIYFQYAVDTISNLDCNKNLYVFKNKNFKINKEIDIKEFTSSISSISSLSKSIFYDFWLALKLIKIVKVEKISTIHFTTAHVSNLFLATLAKLFRVTLIFTIHDIVPHPGFKSVFIRLYNKLVISYLGNKIIVFNKNQLHVFKEKNIIPLRLSGFPINIDSPKIGNTILFFGRIDKYKGLGNLLEIIKQCNEGRQSDIQFVIAGKGSIKNIDEFEKIKNVKIVNRFISEEEVPKLFLDAKIVILPYDSATQSGVIILSYSFATPVLAFDVGGLPEYIENHKTGLIVKHKNIEEMVRLIKELKHNDVLVKEMSKNVIDTFKSKYSKQAFISQYKIFYKAYL